MHNHTDIPLEIIDLKNRTYKISRNRIDEKLSHSIQHVGILHPPVLLKEKLCYTVIAGFNRLDVLRCLDRRSVTALVLDRIDPDFFLQYGLLKSYRNEIGPMGKLKFVSLLKDQFKFDDDRILAIGKTGLNIPADYITGASLKEKIKKFPGELADYIDTKDVNFRIISDLCRMPDEIIAFLDRMVSKGSVRINIFKKIIDMVYDIIKRDGSTGGLIDTIKTDDSVSDRYDESLYDAIFRVRYPEYTAKRDRAAVLIDRLSGDSVKVQVPEYFEGNKITLSATISRNDDLKLLGESIRSLLFDRDMDDLLHIV